jgi:hypothetical protein
MSGSNGTDLKRISNAGREWIKALIRPSRQDLRLIRCMYSFLIRCMYSFEDRSQFVNFETDTWRTAQIIHLSLEIPDDQFEVVGESVAEAPERLDPEVIEQLGHPAIVVIVRVSETEKSQRLNSFSPEKGVCGVCVRIAQRRGIAINNSPMTVGEPQDDRLALASPEHVNY